MTPAEADALQARLLGINRTATVARTTKSCIDLSRILGIRAFDVSRAAAIPLDADGATADVDMAGDGKCGEGCTDPGHKHAAAGSGSGAHTHDAAVGTVLVQATGAVDEAKVGQRQQQ